MTGVGVAYGMIKEGYKVYKEHKREVQWKLGNETITKEILKRKTPDRIPPNDLPAYERPKSGSWHDTYTPESKDKE